MHQEGMRVLAGQVVAELPDLAVEFGQRVAKGVLRGLAVFEQAAGGVLSRDREVGLQRIGQVRNGDVARVETLLQRQRPLAALPLGQQAFERVAQFDHLGLQARRQALLGVVVHQAAHTGQRAAHRLARIAFVLKVERLPDRAGELGETQPQPAGREACDVAEQCNRQARQADQAERLHHQHGGGQAQTAPVGGADEEAEEFVQGDAKAQRMVEAK